MIGVLLFTVAGWLLSELWLAMKPRAIADDFLKLLHDWFALLGALVLSAVVVVLYSFRA